MEKQKHPERMCLGCRKRAAKKALVRFVCSSGELRMDTAQRAEGRGVYCHAAVGCLHELRNRSRWEAALRIPNGTIAEGPFIGFMNETRRVFEGEEQKEMDPKTRKGKIRF